MARRRIKNIALIILCALTACNTPQGTRTANPLDPQSKPPDAGPSSQQIFVATCKVLEKCNGGMDDYVCGNGIANLTGFASKLGITLVPPPNPVQILQLEQGAKLTVNATTADRCEAQILKLSCRDQMVIDAYVPSAATPFLNTPDMLNPVCAGTFSP